MTCETMYLITWTRTDQRHIQEPLKHFKWIFYQFKAENYLQKMSIFDTWLGPECTSADGYNTFLKSQTETNHFNQIEVAEWAHNWEMSFKPDPFKQAQEVNFFSKD